MNDNLRRRYVMLLSVLSFGVQYAAFFAINSLGHQLFEELRAIVNEIEQLAAAKESNSRAAREGTTNREEARTDLREEMEDISDTARSMALVTPGLEDKFRIPRGKVSDVDLLNIARAFAKDALPLKDEFIRYGLPADFLERLNAGIAAFEQAIDKQQMSRRSKKSATAGLPEAVERGVNKVRQLNAVVRNTFRDDPVKLAEWESASHTQRAPQTPDSANPQQPPTS
jgi:hypothetical protein